MKTETNSSKEAKSPIAQNIRNKRVKDLASTFTKRRRLQVHDIPLEDESTNKEIPNEKHNDKRSGPVDKAKSSNPITIKQEDHDDLKTRLYQPATRTSSRTKSLPKISNNDNNEILPYEFAADLYCRVCKRSYKSMRNYHAHLKLVHKMKLEPPIKIKQKVTNVDFDDPNFYCSICNYSLANKTGFRKHLSKTHNLKISEPRKGKQDINPDIEPDIDDPNKYCRTCDIALQDRHYFCQHLRRMHNIKVSIMKKHKPNPEVEPDRNDPNYYCRSCLRSYHNKHNYYEHIRRMHNSTPTRPKLNIDPNIAPDVNDPNFYCKSCKSIYKNKDVYRRHLRRVHKMILEPLVKLPAFKPRDNVDLNDPNNTYCIICKITYANRTNYNHHLRKRHNYGNSSNPVRRKSKVNPNIEPDMNDPNSYCRSCQITLSTKVSYQHHLRTIHDMEVKTSTIIPNHDIIPDMNDPNLYCSSCNHTYHIKSYFHKHMKKVHGLKQQ